MPREKILVTVKTYPTLSRKYGETVCTAGVREDGSWVRIYPVPFRRLNESEQYHFLAPNPWVIIGVFQIPYERQPELF